MNNSGKYKLYCLGSRGSRANEGTKFFHFGGYTTCYILKKGDYALVIDCGTGFYSAGSYLANCKTIDFVFTHMHYDHILGMLDWGLIPKGAKVNYYGKFSKWFGDKTFDEFFKAPFWPVVPQFNTHDVDGTIVLNNELNVRFHDAPHPNDSALLTIEYEYEGKNEKIVVMFDAEDPNFLPFEEVYKCNILLYDGMYDDKEYPKRVGWGHSTWQEGCKLACRAQCDLLIVTHHEPNRTDDELLEYEKKAREIYSSTDFAYATQSWDFPYVADKTENKKSFIVNNRLASIIQNFKDYFKKSIVDTKRFRHILLEISCCVLAGVSFFMTIVNIITNKVPVLYATAFFTVACSLNVIMLFYGNEKLHIIAKRLFQVEMYALVMFFIISGSPEGFSALWTLLIPTAGVLVFGRKETSILSGILFVSMMFLFRSDIGRSLLMYDYTESFLLRFPMAFIAFFAMAFFLETVRRMTLNLLWEVKEKQEEEIAMKSLELKDQYTALESAKNRLELRNNLLSKTFGKFMPDEIISILLANDGQFDFTASKRKVTALQCDIRGFTALTNTMDGMSVMTMLNHYLGEMTEVIKDYNGTIMEFIGDGILAVFGAPNDNEMQADDAIAAAIAIQKKLKEVNKWNKEKGYPEFEIGIGINTGEAVMGLVGSEQRLKYDIVGRTVNICSRIEAFSTNNQILISKDVFDATKSTIQIRNEMTVSPKGLNETITVFDVTGIFGKYNLVSNYLQEEMKELDKYQDIELTCIKQESHKENRYKAKVVALSKNGMVVETGDELEIGSGIKIENHGDIIGIVKEKENNRYTINYTNVN